MIELIAAHLLLFLQDEDNKRNPLLIPYHLLVSVGKGLISYIEFFRQLTGVASQLRIAPLQLSLFER